MSKCFDCGKEHLKSKGGMGYCGNCGKWTSKRIDSDMSALKTTYSLEQVLQILRNVGTDSKCGACMEIAFTGSTISEHEHSSGTLLGTINTACNKLGM